MTKIVSILGCGWLGTPLGVHLRRAGYTVKGSVTSVEKFDLLRHSGIKPTQLVVTESALKISDPEFFDTDVLIISIPPRRIEGIERIFPAQIDQIINSVLNYKIEKVIFISSTSVYPEIKQLARETDQFSPDKESGTALLRAENLLKNVSDFKTTIIRFGGLIGADRNPARFLQKSGTPIANVPVNLIHLDDCIGIIAAVLERDYWNEILNACCPEHPLKREFYGEAAKISGLPIPQFSDDDSNFKIVDSSKLIQQLNYNFKYRSPSDYILSLKVE
jgi:nucleoside-diphosphate-sugar epimerase